MPKIGQKTSVEQRTLFDMQSREELKESLKPNRRVICWPSSKQLLLKMGLERADAFIAANNLPPMTVVVNRSSEWHFGVCAYWREDEVQICLEKCASPATEAQSRNYSWPGCVTDREPYGVIAHELGHHCDYHRSERKGRYYGNFSIELWEEAGELPITSYCPNNYECFAECMRLFITNHALLKLIRPKTWSLLRQYFNPVSHEDWQVELGSNIPTRVLKSQEAKIPKKKR